MSRNSLSIVVTSIIFTIFFSTSCKSTQFSRFDCNVAFEIELLINLSISQDQSWLRHVQFGHFISQFEGWTTEGVKDLGLIHDQLRKAS